MLNSRRALPLIFAAALCGVTLFVSWQMAVARLPRQQAALERFIEQHTGLSLRFEEARLRLSWRGPEAVLRQVSLRDAASTQRGTQQETQWQLQAAELVLRFDAWNLLRQGELRPVRAVLRRADIDYLAAEPRAKSTERQSKILTEGQPPNAERPVEALRALAQRLPQLRIDIEDSSILLRAPRQAAAQHARWHIRTASLHREAQTFGASASLIPPGELGRHAWFSLRLHGPVQTARAPLNGQLQLRAWGLKPQILALWWPGVRALQASGELTLQSKIAASRVEQARLQWRSSETAEAFTLRFAATPEHSELQLELPPLSPNANSALSVRWNRADSIERWSASEIDTRRLQQLTELLDVDRDAVLLTQRSALMPLRWDQIQANYEPQARHWRFAVRAQLPARNAEPATVTSLQASGIWRKSATGASVHIERAVLQGANWRELVVADSDLRLAKDGATLLAADLRIDAGRLQFAPQLAELEQLRGELRVRAGRLLPSAMRGVWDGRPVAFDVASDATAAHAYSVLGRTSDANRQRVRFVARLTDSATGLRVERAAVRLGGGVLRLPARSQWRIEGQLPSLELASASLDTCALPVTLDLRLTDARLGGQSLGALRASGRCDAESLRWQLAGRRLAGRAEIAARSSRVNVELQRLRLPAADTDGSLSAALLAQQRAWQLRIADLRAGSLGPMTLEARLQPEAGNLTIESLSVRARGEYWRGSGRCMRSAAECSLEFAGSSDELLAGLGLASQLRGRLTSHGELTWPLAAAGGARQAVRGEWVVEARDLQPRSGTVAKLREPWLLAGVAQGYGFFGVSGAAQFAGRWRIADGSAKIEAGKLWTPESAVTLGGSLALASGRVDLRLDAESPGFTWTKLRESLRNAPDLQAAWSAAVELWDQDDNSVLPPTALLLQGDINAVQRSLVPTLTAAAE